MTQQDDITQRVLTDSEILAIGAMHGRPSVALLPMFRALERAVLSKLRAPVSSIREGFELTYAADADDPACAADLFHFTNGWRACVMSQLRAPVADTLPLEAALHVLVDKIVPGLDTGDLVHDAGRASAMLSGIMASAPVADRRQAVAYLDLGTGGYMDMDTDLTDEELAALPKGRHMLAIIGTHGINGYTPVSAPIADERAVETFAERFALALKPVAYTTKRGAVYLGKSTQVGSENLCTISQAVYEFRAALASAPIPKPWPVEEQPDGAITPVDPVDMASAPVAGEAQRRGKFLPEHVTQQMIWNVQAVIEAECNGLALDTRQARNVMSFLMNEHGPDAAPQASASQPVGRVRHFNYSGVARNGFSQEAVLNDDAPTLPDGALLDAAPQASAEDERGHADGWAAGWDQAIKQSLADKDGGQQPNWISDWSAAIKSLPMGRSEGVVDKSPNLQGSSVDRSTDLQGDKDGGQQRAGDGKEPQ